MITTLIGDIHGKTWLYRPIIKENPRTICLGDFGFRMEYNQLGNHLNHKLLMGNHDDYSCIPPNSLGDYGVYNNIFFVRGARSMDKDSRTPGFDWFYNEELSYEKQIECLNLYRLTKPDIVISHDCPQCIRYERFMITDTSPTSLLLDALFKIHEPSIWIFGHHHKSVEYRKNGTLFKCLNEAETYQLYH